MTFPHVQSEAAQQFFSLFSGFFWRFYSAECFELSSDSLGTGACFASFLVEDALLSPPPLLLTLKLQITLKRRKRGRSMNKN